MSISWIFLQPASYVVYAILVFLPLNLCSQMNSVLSDATFYHITWPGEFTIHPNKVERETIVVSTRHNERYRCTIPSSKERYKQSERVSDHDNPREIIDALWGTCSYRIESYWTYEICHGKALRQYHEQMDAGKIVQIQEYFLGTYQGSLEDDMKNNKFETRGEYAKRTVHVANHDWPYVAVNFTDGTLCDISGKPRISRLLYICQLDGRGEILEIKETSTCSYDVVIMTKLLCNHPGFKPDVNLSNNIECFAMDSSPRKPIDLNVQNLADKAFDAGATLPTAELTPPAPEKKTSSNPEPIFSDILNGVYCFTGGSGWWLHEFCLNKYAQQFHRDRKTGQKSTVLLGTWNTERHQKWLEENPEMKFNTGENSIHLFYSVGDWCDLISNHRTVIVQLTCSKLVGSKPFVVHLVETSDCTYRLLVESEMLCPIIDHIGEHGLT